MGMLLWMTGRTRGLILRSEYPHANLCECCEGTDRAVLGVSSLLERTISATTSRLGWAGRHLDVRGFQGLWRGLRFGRGGTSYGRYRAVVQRIGLLYQAVGGLSEIWAWYELEGSSIRDGISW